MESEKQLHGTPQGSGNFWYLFAGLLLTLLALPFMGIWTGPERYAMTLIFNLSMLISVWSLVTSRHVFRLGMLLVVAISIIAGINFVGDIQGLEHFGLVLMLLFDVVSCLIAARNVFVWHRADLNSLVGAFCVYLLLGLIWAVLYRLLQLFGWATFSGYLAQEGQPLFPALTYFSFVTLASLGYGDIAPVGPLVRTFAYLEAVIGQFYLAVMVASLVGAYTSRRISRASPALANQDHISHPHKESLS